MGAGDRQTNRCNTSLAGFLKANALMNDPERYEIAFLFDFFPLFDFCGKKKALQLIKTLNQMERDRKDHKVAFDFKQDLIKLEHCSVEIKKT